MAITVEDFQTDDSMKDIDYQDICSDNDIQLDNDNVSVSSNPMRFKRKKSLRNSIAYNLMQEATHHTTPLEHYINLKKKKELERKHQRQKNNQGAFLADDDNQDASKFLAKLQE